MAPSITRRQAIGTVAGAIAAVGAIGYGVLRWTSTPIDRLVVVSGETYVIASGGAETYHETVIEPGGELVQEVGSDLTATGHPDQ